MRYLPHTPEDIQAMLETVGVESLDDLFSSIPRECRLNGPLDLPKPLDEWELTNFMEELSRSSASPPDYKVYMGAGSYEHYIPSSVSYLLGRSEFVTSYTPYQPEISQGTLQAIYEYQTLSARLLGMEAANASLYDGATALAEAILMSLRITKRKKAAISYLVNPLYRRVVDTYLAPSGCELIEIPSDGNGHTDLESMVKLGECASVVVQSPNFLGCIEDIRSFSERAHDEKALSIVSFSEPLCYGLYKSPGELGADIVCGEGQSLGIPQSFGGPGLGMFATHLKYVRNMPGRLVGKTIDREGRRGFVLTLATREQHIRRERATSNICTNNSLCALACAMYTASLGGSGIRELARLNYDKTEYLKKKLLESGIRIPFQGHTFNEFVAELPGFAETHGKLLERKLVAGLPIGRFNPHYKDHYLFCVTETKSRNDLDYLVGEVTA